MNNIELVLKGYNEEKRILTIQLSQLGSGNDNICTRGSITRRLTEIDANIEKLLLGQNNLDKTKNKQ